MARKKYNQVEEWEKIKLDSQTRIIACSIILGIDVIVYGVLFFTAMLVDVFFPASVVAFLIAIGCIVVITIGIHDISMVNNQLRQREYRIQRKKKRR